jgi:hypothetical protein
LIYLNQYWLMPPTGLPRGLEVAGHATWGTMTDDDVSLTHPAHLGSSAFDKIMMHLK